MPRRVGKGNSGNPKHSAKKKKSELSSTEKDILEFNELLDDFRKRAERSANGEASFTPGSESTAGVLPDLNHALVGTYPTFVEHDPELNRLLEVTARHAIQPAEDGCFDWSVILEAIIKERGAKTYSEKLGLILEISDGFDYVRYKARAREAKTAEEAELYLNMAIALRELSLKCTGGRDGFCGSLDNDGD